MENSLTEKMLADIIEMIKKHETKLFQPSQVSFETPLQIKNTPHQPPLVINACALGSNDHVHVWIDEKWVWVQSHDTAVINTLYQRLRLLQSEKESDGSTS